MSYNIKIDGTWILVFAIMSMMIILFSVVGIILIIECLEIRLNCICICMGIRLSETNRFLSIPLFCICRRRRSRSNTRILPIIAPKLFTADEYCDLTGNKIIFNPDNSVFLGIKY
jgi:hypothetical protein